MQCVFCGIVEGSVPAKFEYEDDDLVAFPNIHPESSVHVLLIPKRHIENLVLVKPEDAEILGRVQVVIGKLVNQLGIADSYKIVVNGGRLQEVPHLHYHILKGE